MIYKKNFLQGREFAPPGSLIRILPPTSLLTVAFVLLTTYLASAQVPTCVARYSPGTQQQRLQAGLLDGRVGQIKVVNNTETAAIISLYHPDAPKQVFKYWYAEPGQSYLLGIDNYSGDWGIQIDEGPICFVGRVATWDGRMFTTFPSRLFIADSSSPPNATVSRGQTGATSLQPQAAPAPETYEAIATRQISVGEARSGLISLLRAADLYRASGRSKEEQRVRDRINQIRSTAKAAVPEPSSPKTSNQ
ncbi:MAG: hypothetical protein ACAF41_09510 [Leptolyngbya sp. BL-A-14]